MTRVLLAPLPTIRWDTISLSFPNGVGTVDAGGSDYALADDLTTIQIVDMVLSAAPELR